MTKVLVTGGAGFIGSHVCRALINRGDHVVCIDDFNNYYDPLIKHHNICGLVNSNHFKLFKIDIRNKEKLEEIFKTSPPEKIIHLAARAGVRPSIENPGIYAEVNINGTLNLLDLAVKYEISNFVYASSSSVYGNSTETPFKETHDVNSPISPYAASKKSAELLCATYSHLYKLSISCLRFFTVYGPHGRPDMAPYLFMDAIFKGKPIKKFGDGTSRRDYTYIEDIVNGVLAAVDKKFNYEIINLGNSNTISLNEFIRVIENVVGKKAQIIQEDNKPGDVQITYADISKAKDLLNFSPSVNIKEGMEKMFKWYLKCRESNFLRNKLTDSTSSVNPRITSDIS